VSPVELNATVLEPALRLGEDLLKGKSGAGVQTQVARLYAERGALLRENSAEFPESWRQQVFDAYRRAAELDPGEGAYLVEMAFAQRILPGADPTAIRQAAEKAVRKARDYPRAHYLLALLLFDDPARGEARLRHLKAAVAACEAGIQLYDKNRKPDETLPDLLTTCSAVTLSLANSEVSRAESLKYRLAARDHARRATMLERKYREYAWTALGNAHEELAYFHENPRENYGVAVRAFTEAKDLRPDFPKSWLDLGRCQYRWVAFGKHDAKLLDEAVDALQRAVEEGPRSREGVEAGYWLGKVHEFRGQFAEADKAFQKAAAAAEALDPANWKTYVLARAKLALTEARRQPKNAEAALTRARATVELVLKKLDRDVEAAKLLGESFLVQDDPVRALSAYQRGLPEDRSAATSAHVELLLACVDCRLTPKGLKDPKLTPDSLVAEADRVVSLARSTGSTLEGAALGSAGLARVWALHSGKLEREAWPRYRKEAVAQLKLAIELDPEHSSGWLWRYLYARELRQVKTPSDNVKKLKAEALARLKEAKAKAPTAADRNNIDDVIRTWEAE
jgi:tetratricopeptide (TPR) repeat protein